MTQTEHTMSIDCRSPKQPVRPSYPEISRARKAALALVAVLVSSTLVGGMLSMFEMRSQEAAMAQTSVETAPSSDRFALRKPGSEPRG